MVQDLQQEQPLVFISEDGDAAFSTDELAGPQAATVAAVDDRFYVATSDDPDSFDHDEESIGTLHATAIVGHGGRAVWNVVFEFDDGAMITAVGSLGVSRGRPGPGVATVIGGTGRFRGLRGELEVRVKNPHRWSVVL